MYQLLRHRDDAVRASAKAPSKSPQRRAIIFPVVRVQFTNRKRRPIRCAQQGAERRHELIEPEPCVTAGIFRERHIHVVKHVNIQMDEQSLKLPRPASYHGLRNT